MLKNIHAAIFDMDGTLIDSMWVWDTIDEDYLNKRNIKIPSDLRDDITHLSFIEVANYFKKRFNLSESIEEILSEWNDMAFYHYANTIKLKSGAKEYLETLKKKGIKLGLATSNYKMLIETVLKKNDVFDLFDIITTTDEVQKDKSFPDIYLLSAERLGVSPENCIVFEDILPAVLGAKAAGMQVIGVHDSFSEHQHKEIMKNVNKFIFEYKELLT